MTAIHTFTAPESWPDILTNLNTNFDNINVDLLAAEADIVTLQSQISVADASTTVKWPTKLSVAPASASEPIAVGTNDPRIPTQAENDAMAWTAWTPSATNKFVTADDTNLTNNVKLTGDQTVAGIKTFSSIPELPASDPTTANQAVRKAYADSLLTVWAVLTFTDTWATGIFYRKVWKMYFWFSKNTGLRIWWSTGRSGAASVSVNRIASVLWFTAASYWTISSNTDILDWSGSTWTSPINTCENIDYIIST